MHDGLSQRWCEAALQRELGGLWPGLRVEVVARAGSTNTLLLERARAPHFEPCLLVAQEQTAGRGRRGRVWQSSAGASLTFSLALPLEMADWSGLSLAVGVALADAIELIDAKRAATRIGLKWPNDLWIIDADAAGGGRKLGGVLIETACFGSGAQRIGVIGIGLNVASLRVEGAGSGVASVHELLPEANAPALLARVAGPLLRALRCFERAGFAAFAARFAARDLLRGQTVSSSGPQALDGVAEGVAANGALLLRTAAGVQAVTSGDVSVRPRGVAELRC